ncbi:hypothetical protein ACHQM5_028434 [Ranunculus cassubicifolius]
MMDEHKRGPAALEPCSFISESDTGKRHKTEVCISRKEKKELLGKRIATLQQLVSPFGKTDTASVLYEAIEYINFLHDQVKVLSAPYLLSGRKEMAELEQHNLRSCGLCLMPISCTVRVAGTNGADIWSSMNKNSPKS